MSEYRKYLLLDDELYDYALAHTTAPDGLQARLIARTADLGDSRRMQVAHSQALFMTFVTRSMGARRALEIGTFTGYSALAIARGLPADGTLVACDVSEDWTSIAREAWSEAGLSGRIDLRIGPALETVGSLPTDPPFDLVFIDADKESYIEYYEAVLPRLSPEGLLLADNTLWEGKVVDREFNDEPTRAIRAFNEHVSADPRTEQVLLPLADGLTVVRLTPGAPRPRL
ncbi:MAG: O-methyltransferase [marine benthic group bacterium]|nr:O-methyltransferase [Candidatus Benthicola marisminoris]